MAGKMESDEYQQGLGTFSKSALHAASVVTWLLPRSPIAAVIAVAAERGWVHAPPSSRMNLRQRRSSSPS
jgi:hypothetical protein